MRVPRAHDSSSDKYRRKWRLASDTSSLVAFLVTLAPVDCTIDRPIDVDVDVEPPPPLQCWW